ncbi:hypothetical protein FNI43_21450 [Salmonella enterica subsp. diarizonae]|nr:hypothetical protein [Salmonella enterica subsp. diarizonae]
MCFFVSRMWVNDPDTERNVSQTESKRTPHNATESPQRVFSVMAYKDTPANKNATGAALAVFLHHLLRTVFKCRLNAFYIGGYFTAFNFGRRQKKSVTDKTTYQRHTKNPSLSKPELRIFNGPLNGF